MIRSMTGYGSAASPDPQLPAAVTVRSVNHRFLDLTVRTPSRLRSLEPELRGLVSGRLRRGKIEVSVRVGGALEETPVRLSTARARSAAQALRDLKDQLGLDGGVTVADVARVPGVLESLDSEDDLPSPWGEQVLSAARTALDGLDAMRQAEGEALLGELRSQLAEVRSCATGIEELVGAGKEARAAALQARATELVGDLGLDSGKLYQEVMRGVERYDVAEEVERLRSHVGQIESLLASGKDVGKRLDFLSQELMREANTVGSKAPSAAVVALVVQLKGVIERFREQVQNVE